MKSAWTGTRLLRAGGDKELGQYRRKKGLVSSNIREFFPGAGGNKPPVYTEPLFVRLRPDILLQGRGQDFRVNRFGDMVIHSGLQAVLHIVREGICRHGNDGNRLRIRTRQGADGPRCFDAVHDGHAQIHQDGCKFIGSTGLERFQSQLAVFGGDDGQLLVVEQSDGNLPVQGIVLAEEQLFPGQAAIAAGSLFWRSACGYGRCLGKAEMSCS